MSCSTSVRSISNISSNNNSLSHHPTATPRNSSSWQSSATGNGRGSNFTAMSKRRKIVYGWFNFIFLCWIMFAEQFVSVLSLKDLKIFVPDAVIMGNAATLSCQFELEKATLYSVRWYFESEEFYRYVPKESPPARTFPVSGITVDGSQSDATSVTLRGVTRDLTGQFQCEVSEDAPLFHTDIRQARMQVVELPKQDPQMQLDKTHITTLDNFRAVCTVGTSFPPANITWYINAKKIHRSPYQRITYRSYEGTPTFSSLEMFPHSQVLQDIYQSMPPFQTSLTVMCEITILHIYTKSAQQMIIVSDLVTTISPALLGLDGSNNRRKANGDPDNSALTGAGARLPATGPLGCFLATLTVALLLQMQRW
ncbi:uncharacterized protein LOC129718471 isoform X1 [Wyeomyia smithii]|uniref:uncharacterized protein LOC129718471 isoform X1 n=2 Tax=Wyeomyia smithii TaxID=174621 RepID=UPI002468004A|nr:uncharacterized protein LOC129718471 isoform X1 [Wyeomyia smithii]XP_055525234.1 uncharacterized protein LOC129718471 isoform X1 [Wyeomyia smithii]XP_055525235.1 uncharacterized protein LOC129718471 isoform X1 [Wyeomyia smithii]